MGLQRPREMREGGPVHRHLQAETGDRFTDVQGFLYADGVEQEPPDRREEDSDPQRMYATLGFRMPHLQEAI